TASRIGGVGITTLAAETIARHARAYPGPPGDLLPVVGLYAWRRDGEHHQWNPETIALLQHAVRHGGFETFEQYSRAVNDESARRERRLTAVRDQAGRLGPLRRDRPLSDERGRAPDQDGAGGKAGGRRPAAGPQGRPLHRQRAAHHTRRRPDLAAASPRHLLDR